MPQTALEAIRAAQLYADPEEYLMLKYTVGDAPRVLEALNVHADPFCAVMVDKDETTVFVKTAVYEQVQAQLPAHETSDLYRLITFDLDLEPTLTGFMAMISGALAESGVPILPLAAFSRDHILVPASHFSQAIASLEKLRSQAAGG